MLSAAVTLKRKTILITFSRDFESHMLTSNFSRHESLSQDIELHARRALEKFAELEDVKELQHPLELKELIKKSNQLAVMESNYFTEWKLAIEEDLLDEIDLVILAHGEDLKQLGLADISQGGVLVLLTTMSLFI